MARRTLPEVVGSGGHARSRAVVERACDVAADGRSLRLQVVEEIRRAVPFDAYAWLLTDPETSVGAGPMADVPCLPELPRLIRLKYLTAVNRWTALGGAPVAFLHEATGGDLSRSLVWRDLLSRYGVVDVASVAFHDQFGCWGFLDLWRSGTAAPFAPSDAAYLTGLVEPLTRGLRRCQAATFVARPAGDRRALGPVVLLLSPDLEALRHTPDTEEVMRALVPPEEGRAPVPAAAYNVAAQLLAGEAGVDDNPPWARAHVADGLWVTVRAARIGDRGPPDGRDIAVTVAESSPHERVSVFARAFGLTRRERELLVHLAGGADTRELAARLFLSEHTVQDHLKSICAKTAARTRRTLLSRALGA